MPKAVTIEKVDGKPGKVYYPLKCIDQPQPSPKSNELVIRISAAALNHRDLFIRQHLYPGTTFGVPLLADGAGIVTATGSSDLDAKWKGKRVVLTPSRGWDKSPDGPEGPFAILGGTKDCAVGTLQELVTVDAAEVEEAPIHLTSVEAAALPLTGLTAWRAVFTKSGNAKPGHNLLITGIGGGVALMALQLASANGCNVYVTSGSEEKIQKARELGAQGGVNYRAEGWEKELVKQLPASRKYIDAVIDGAGGDTVDKSARFLKPGGVIVSYGMTTGPKMNYSMGAVLKNIEVRGSTMGSREEFSSMISFISAKLLRPIISRAVHPGEGFADLSVIDSLFEDMKSGKQFGKLVVDILKEGGEEKSRL
ncbi:MAG: hypothetical protein M4579_000664 [Chaenotheca gracillima]|nr:MAG: hypothetical protein M4579_000664 [Chaenotheca gracillima]